MATEVSVELEEEIEEMESGGGKEEVVKKEVDGGKEEADGGKVEVVKNEEDGEKEEFWCATGRPMDGSM